MQGKEVERFRLRARCFHWTIVLFGLVLGLTGLFLYVPAFGVAAQGGYTRVIHRVAAIIFILTPLVYFVWNPRNVLHFIKDILTFGKDDLEWAKAAPDYYFGGDESKMPTQGHVNAGQKLYALCAVGCGVGLAVTGLIMWFGKGNVSSAVFLWSTFVHDLLFIVFLAFTLVHMYLGGLHPTMTESLRSMIVGKASEDYIKHHYGKWYEKEVVGGEEGEKK